MSEGMRIDLRARARSWSRSVDMMLRTGARIGVCEAQTLLRPRDHHGLIKDHHRHQWSQMILRKMGAEIRVDGLRPDREVARLIISNHRTLLDIPLMLRLFGGGFLSRADLARWPLIGRGARIFGVVFVQRGSKKSGSLAIERMRQSLLQEKLSITVFPEGTTFVGDEVRPFRPGAFRAVAGTDVEILPVGVAYPPGTEFGDESFLSHGGSIARRPHTPIGVAIGEPIKAGGSVPQMQKDTRGVVQELVNRARKLL